MRIRRLSAFGAALVLVSALLAVVGPVAPATAQVARPGRAYVTDLFAGTVSVIDTTTNTIVDTVPVGSFPTNAVASPDGSKVYVSIGDESAVAVFETATNTVTNRIPVGDLPSGIAFSPDGATAYVANGASQDVSVIDTASETVTTTIPLPDGANPIGIAISADGSTVYVANSGLDSIAVIDTASNTVTDEISVGTAPFDVAVSAVGNRAYVTNSGSGDVSVIDTATNTVIATVPVGPNPRGIAVGPEGSEAYVANSDGNTMSVIDTASNTVTGTFPLGIGGPMYVAVTSNRVYVTALSGALVVFDRGAEAVLATVIIGEEEFSGFAWGVAVIPGNIPPPAATPTITTQASPSTIAGGPITDTATLSGGANPTGVVIFRLYNDAACLNEVFTSTNPLVGSTATSTPHSQVAGTYYWRALYTGDANNNPAANPCNAPHESVVVRPFGPSPFTRTISGDFLGPLTVRADESVQIVNARVAGPITVEPGGELTVVSSQIARGIIANAPDFLRICGSQLSPARGNNQALAVFDAPVPVLIGDTSVGCAGNRFAGDVNLIGNYGLTFGNNIVSGNTTANDGGAGPTVIKSNNITGALACSGNNPPPSPTRPLNRNTAGSRSGQCVPIPPATSF